MTEILKYIQENNLATRDRYRHYTYKRFYLYNLLRNEGHTLYEIADMFNRDHASIIHGIKTHRDLMATNDKIYLDFVEELRLIFEAEPMQHNLIEDVLNCHSLERLKKIKFRIKNNLYI